MEAPNGMLRGGIPEESVDWLEAPFDKNKQLETEQDLETDAADGYRAVNYIALGLHSPRGRAAFEFDYTPPDWLQRKGTPC